MPTSIIDKLRAAKILWRISKSVVGMVTHLRTSSKSSILSFLSLAASDPLSPVFWPTRYFGCPNVGDAKKNQIRDPTLFQRGIVATVAWFACDKNVKRSDARLREQS